MNVEPIANEILKRAAGAARFVVAIAGPPGAGKSTLSDALAEALVARGEKAAVLPMDGFHMDNAVLEEKGLLPRKGAPETFDVRAFLSTVQAVRANDGEVLVPVFDRSRELAIASARIVAPETRMVLVEGNYLLLDEAPWNKLAGAFDFSIFINPGIEELERRLLKRWYDHGYEEEAAKRKAHGNDIPNAHRVVEHQRRADLVLADF
ncbi:MULTISPECIES: nucleoside triphosphate hydrolase [Sinorhizobium/Ensifer group]|jgi:pantothenate kinase|uniref:nucleoside triphosphate hydrolase n=1 Tax=Sinorhizobium/Ensifer group TaxID=227292 RepID=UPI000710B52C|nr:MULTISPECIES: nucleoside triphosphate hydrolase [Sinorhizobium/Ensifer group]KRD73203.1 nucleoside triphosphate hydrolase [Ensifer sp. Root278]KSV65174.1 nucleoside triphosphate hydrolase [Sinorhizobium sp. Sb3]KSV88920.1 nucleoside triphosphate hydrolase [Sinorhizobium sp. GL28]MBD9505572.1 nucleoside triphosphate hydrolase [Ensifer sp. ENS10]MBV7516591.1 nucleoside triphosphate hydrolase [Ensifer sp. ENS12]